MDNAAGHISSFFTCKNKVEFDIVKLYYFTAYKRNWYKIWEYAI